MRGGKREGEGEGQGEASYERAAQHLPLHARFDGDGVHLSLRFGVGRPAWADRHGSWQRSWEMCAPLARLDELRRQCERRGGCGYDRRVEWRGP